MEYLWHELLPPLLLLLAANGAPILAQRLLGRRFDSPLDGGLRLRDDRPLLGPTKSWRGLIAAITLTTLLSLALGMAWWQGALFGLLCMLGDMVASFTKRRLGIAPQGRALALDQLPEALLPLWLLRDTLGLELQGVVIVALLFMVLELLLSPLLFRWRLRLRPY